MDAGSALIELQRIDVEILRNRKALEKIPEAAKVAEVRSRLKELARRTTKIVGLLKDQEMACRDGQEDREDLMRRAHDLERENARADFRRVRDNNAELDRIAKRVEKIDYDAEKAKGEIRRLHDLLDQSQKIKEALEQRERELLVAFRDSAKSLREDLGTLAAQRETCLASLAPELRERYAASCKAHGAVGAAQLDGGTTCTGCGMQLQPSQIDALRVGPDISTCPVCGRLLVVRTHA